MQNVPKIVTERLKTVAPVQHPDADALTAFAERSLSDRERMAVLEHISRCGDCRDTVALALPEVDPGTIVLRPVHRPWFAWPALRWGFAAAGLAVLATLGVVQYRHRAQTNANAARPSSFAAPQTQAQAQLQMPPAVQPPAEQLANNAAVFPDQAKARSARSDTKSGGAAGPRVIPADKRRERDADRGKDNDGLMATAGGPVVYGQTRVPSNPPSGGVGGPLAQHQNAPLQWQQAPAAAKAYVPVPAVNQPNAAPAASPAPQAAETVEVQAANAQVNPEAATTLPRTSGEAAAEDDSGLRRAKPVDAAVLANGAGQAQAASGSLGVDGRNFTQLVKMSSIPVPQWTINPAGGLARSFDQGGTWQDVDVNAASTTSGLRSYDKLSAISKQRAGENKKDLKTLAPIFRAVSAMGMEVWAGGSGGALYHSGDAGNHWTRVLPVAGGVNLSGDIVSLEFLDVQHGKVTTSTGESWITADDGQTWQKQ